MALITKPRVAENCSAPGVGAFTLTGAPTGRRRFSAVCSTNDTVYYEAVGLDSDGNEDGKWEEGLGTYSALNTLTRTTVLYSSTGSAVDFTGSTLVFLTAAADQIGTVNPATKDDAYDATTWNGDLTVPTKNAIRDKFESLLAGAEVLSASRDYYVRTDGSDSNSGLANTAGGAFLTIQKAIDVATLLIAGNNAVTINIADGTYSGQSINCKPFLINPDYTFMIFGNFGTPTNVVFDGAVVANCAIGGMTFTQNATAEGGLVYMDSIRAFEFKATRGALLDLSSCKKDSSANGHAIYADASSKVVVGSSFEVLGTPALSTAFAVCKEGAVIDFFVQPTGSPTGSRYSATMNGIINTSGGGANYLPGNAAGSTATGGQYI